MRSLTSKIVCVVLMGVLATPAWADCPPPLPGENAFLRGQVMLRVSNYTTIDDVLATLNQTYPGTSILTSLDSRSTYLLQIPPGLVDCDVLENLLGTMVANDPNAVDPNRPLLWAELNYETEASEGSTGTIYISYQLPNAYALYQSQYATNMLALSTAQSAATGRGVMVALLDTGLDATHPQLQSAALPGYNFLTDTANTAESGDGLDTDGDGMVDEMLAHGTFMAGLIHLVAPEARILPVVVLDSDGYGNAFQIAEGIYYAIDHGADVINMSFGSTHDSDVVNDAIKEARSRGVVVVAAAGNDNRNEPPREPAASQDLLGVAATNEQDIRAPFSNYNSDLSVSAPGNTTLTINNTPDPTRSIISTGLSGGYGVWDGTSTATAFVSGTVALVRAQHPDWPAEKSTAETIIEIIRQTAAPIDALNPGFEGLLGTGRLNAGAAVMLGPVQPIAGDINADGAVDLGDLGLLLVDFGQVQSAADINGDGRVDVTDLGIVLTNYGQ